MKQLQYIRAVALIVALTGLSPMVVAGVAGDKERSAHSQSEPVPPQKIELTAHHMDTITAGVTWEDWMKHKYYELGEFLFRDVSGLVRQYHATCVANGGC